MRVLLDTHVFLWWISDDPRLSALAREVIANPGNDVLVSAVSAWEIAIKGALGRIELPDDPERFLPEQLAVNSMTSLPILFGHALRVFHLPQHHRDPFDRLLVAQAQVEGLPIVSGDRHVAKYSVDVLW